MTRQASEGGGRMLARLWGGLRQSGQIGRLRAQLDQMDSTAGYWRTMAEGQEADRIAAEAKLRKVSDLTDQWRNDSLATADFIDNLEALGLSPGYPPPPPNDEEDDDAF